MPETISQHLSILRIPDRDYALKFLKVLLADAWAEGHRQYQDWEHGDCYCHAYYDGECACGMFYTGNLLSLSKNPYLEDKNNEEEGK